MNEIDKMIKEQNCSLMCDTVRQIVNERNRFESRIKALEEENEALKAQRDTYINLMNIYKNISKWRQDSKNVTDYIERLTQKLKIAKTQMTLARDIAYDSSQSEPVRVQIDEILTHALKQMEEVK